MQQAVLQIMIVKQIYGYKAVKSVFSVFLSLEVNSLQYHVGCPGF